MTPEQDARLREIEKLMKGFKPCKAGEAVMATDLVFCLEMIRELRAERDTWKERATRSLRIRESNRLTAK